DLPQPCQDGGMMLGMRRRVGKANGGKIGLFAPEMRPEFLVEMLQRRQRVRGAAVAFRLGDPVDDGDEVAVLGVDFRNARRHGRHQRKHVSSGPALPDLVRPSEGSFSSVRTGRNRLPVAPSPTKEYL